MADIEKQKDSNKDKEKEKEKAAPGFQVEQEGLPKTIVRRLVKDKLSQLSTDTDISLLRDSLLAFSESARIFIHYLSATANDICKESKRQTINAEDVFKALEEIEFPELIEPLKASLEVFREKNSKRKSASSKSAESNKKAKLKENGKGKMEEQEQPSDNENEDAQAGEEINKVEDGEEINEVEDGEEINEVEDGEEINEVEAGEEINEVEDSADD